MNLNEYIEYIANYIDKSINYSDYLAENLDKSIDYSKYLADAIVNAMVKYAMVKSKEQIKKERIAKLNKLNTL